MFRLLYTRAMGTPPNGKYLLIVMMNSRRTATFELKPECRFLYFLFSLLDPKEAISFFFFFYNYEYFLVSVYNFRIERVGKFDFCTIDEGTTSVRIG